MVSGKDWRSDRASFLQAIEVLRRLAEAGPEALMGQLPERLRDTADVMSFSMIDLALEGMLRRRGESAEEQEPPAEETRGFK
jgi:hypothetical protein